MPTSVESARMVAPNMAAYPSIRPVHPKGLHYPDLASRMKRVFLTCWTRCARETDYRQAWAEFERRLGKEMPEGTAL